MLIVGLTGGLGTGKSTAAAMFAQHGAKVIDADAITRDLLAPGKKCVKKVAKIFPGAILKPTYRVDRFELAKIVFSNPQKLKKLTDILYPEALKEVKRQISLYRHEPLVVLDVPLLFESGWDQMADITIMVKATRRQQVERTQKGLGLSKADIGRRIKNQMPLKEKCILADIIIDNSHGLAQMRKQVTAVMHRLKRIR